MARLAGVSIPTVSRVVTNADHPVGEDTRQRVLNAIEALDYTPNALARGLVNGRTKTVGVMVHDITDSYFNEIVRGIEDVAGQTGYLVMVCSSYRDPERELRYVVNLRSQRCDGVVFVAGGLTMKGYLEELQRQLEAIAMQGGAIAMLAPHELKWPAIVPDSRRGLRQVANHLVDLGHRDIALVAGPDHLKTSRERSTALRAALRRHGLTLPPELVVSGGFDREGGARALRRLLDRGSRFTAVVALNDQMAIGCLSAARERRLRVPRDLSVAGFDDLPVVEYLDPPLTTVRVPMRELGRQGMQLVLDQLEGKQLSSWSNSLPCDLVIRASTGPVPDRRAAERAGTRRRR